MSQPTVFDFLKSLRDEQGLSTEEIHEHLASEAIINTLPQLLSDQWKYRNQLALLFSVVSLDDLPERLRAETQAVLDPVPTQYIMRMGEVHDNNPAYLCSKSEGRYLTALEKKALVVANERMLIKFTGRHLGLCLETFSTADGHLFLSGVFYQPISDIDKEESIAEEILGKRSRFQLSQYWWMPTRQVVEFDPDNLDEEQVEDDITIGSYYSASDILLAALVYESVQLPDELPDTIDGISIKEYWLSQRKGRNYS